MFELECVRAFKNSDKYADILRKMVDAFTTENLSLPNQLLTYRKLMKEKAERWIFAERSTKDSAKVTISTNHKAAFFEVRPIINEYRTIRLLKERTFTAAPVALNS